MTMVDNAPPHGDDDAPSGSRQRATARIEPPPPHDLAAEEAVIGGVLVSAGRAYDDAADAGLDPDDFYAPRHQAVWSAVTQLIETGRPADPITVAAQLAARGLLEEIGGNATLIALQASAWTTGAVGHYARIVIGHARLRRLLGAAHEIIRLSNSPVDDVDQAAAAAESLVVHAADRPTASRAEPLQRLVPEWLTHTLGEDHRPPGLDTPWAKLNRITGGFRPGQFIVVFARPGVGKSAWAHNVAANAAADGHPTLLTTLEMASDEVLERIVSAHSHINYGHIRSRHLGHRDREIVGGWGAHIGQWPLHINDNPEQTVLRVHADARRIPGLRLIVVDYVQLLQPPPRPGGRYSNRQEEVSAISKALKVLARTLQVPVVGLVQANREVEGRAKRDRRPVLRDIRESGQLENDADLVLGLYRDELYDPDTKDAGVMEQVVLKQRSGLSNVTVRCGWDGGTQRITDLDATSVDPNQQEAF